MTTVTNGYVSHQQPHVIAALTGNYTQNNALLQLPPEALAQIAEFVGTGKDAETAGKNLVNMGKTCALLHAVTHIPVADKVIAQGEKMREKWVTDANNPFISHFYKGGVYVSSCKISCHV